MENKKLKKQIFKKFGSYKAFLEKTNVSRPTLTDIIKRRSNARAKTVFEICNVLECEPEEVDLEY